MAGSMRIPFHVSFLSSARPQPLAQSPALRPRLFLHLSALPAYVSLFAFRILARGLGKQRCKQWARARGERNVTFWPEREGCAAAAYVALSRVRKDADYLLGGEHFVPAK